MSTPIKVLFSVGRFGSGGSENHLRQLLPRLDPARFTPELMLFRAVDPQVEVVRAMGIPVHDVGYDQRGLAGFLKGMRRIRAILRRVGPDVIQTYGFNNDVFLPLAAWPRGRRRICTSRRGDQMVPRRQRVYRLTNPLVDRVVCVSSPTRDFAVRTEGLPPGKAVVIPNGIDLSTHPDPPPVAGTIRTVGTLGRFEHVKGTDLLLEAFRRLDRPDLVLRVGGVSRTGWFDGIRSRYEGLPGVEFPGEIDDVPAFLRSLDLFVLPSRSEGMSNALLEAMAARRPIVATDVGANREVLVEGEAGLLVPPDSDAIATAIRSLVDDVPWAERLAGEARAQVETRFSLELMVDQYERLYETLMNAAPQPKMSEDDALVGG